MKLLVANYLLGIIFPVGYFGGVLIRLFPPDWLAWAVLAFVLAVPIWPYIIIPTNQKGWVRAMGAFGVYHQLLIALGLLVAASAIS